jgi:hypothetical protein
MAHMLGRIDAGARRQRRLARRRANGRDRSNRGRYQTHSHPPIHIRHDAGSTPLTKGLWRIDWVALASLGDVVRPIRVSPSMVRRGATPDSAALDALTLRRVPLTTLPGDELQLDYRLPEHPERLELFLEARGYYLEWMRREWMRETNPRAAARLLLDPDAMLRDLARPYKRQEAMMDSLFWNSRYAKP